jgi:hypothetical protein
MRRVSSGVGSGASQSRGGVSGFGYVSVSSYVEESDSRGSPVTMDCVPISAMTMTRFGALWRAPPPFAVLRIVAGTR